MGRIRNATDLGIDLDRLAGRCRPSEFILIEGREPWVGELHRRRDEHIGSCQVCGDATLKEFRLCLGCNVAGMDGIAEYDGEPVGSRMDPDYHAEPTAYRPDPRLKGGKR